jgi:hypothetical protein
MTDTTIPLSDLGSNAGDDGKRRDRWGRLLVVPEGGGKPVGYTRYTTIAKTTDDGGGLMPWKATMAVCGTLTQRSIAARWRTLLAEHEHPWYAGPEPKAKCKRLVEEAAEAGGAGDRREEGNALHAVTALVDMGQTPAHLSREMEADVEAYVNKLIEYGITIVDGMVERTVVDDTHRVGGTFDRLVRVNGSDKLKIADLKTGLDLSYSWPAFAVQLGGYSRAEAMYEQGDDPNGSADVRAAMPEVDQDEGLIIWLPAGEARCELITVDLNAGWEGFELALAVRAWRQRKGLSWPLSQWVPAPEPATPPKPKLQLLPPADVSQDEPAVNGSTEYAPDIRAWLQERIDTIGTWHDVAARADLGRSWPQDMPTLRSSMAHTSEQLDQIEAVVDGVETRHSLPFGPTKPGSVHPQERRVERRLLATFPGSTITTKEQSP